MLRSTAESECNADRCPQPTVVREEDAITFVLVDERPEVSQVAAQPYTRVQEVRHAAADVEPEVVLGSALFIRPGTNHTEPCAPERMPFRRTLNADGQHHIAHEADRVGVDVCARAADTWSAVGRRRRIEREHFGI